MKVRELFDFLRGVVPHAYPETVLTAWLNEVEGRVQTEVLLLQDQDLTRLVWPDCEEQELFAKFPYDSIYWTYLAAMCAYASGEMEDYNNHLTLFNERWCMYSAWYADNYRPADGHAVEREYYLTAFSIAQRHGFEGTEEAWLASLKGDKGEPLHWEDLTAEQKAELKGEPGDDGKDGEDGKDGDQNVFIATYDVTTFEELKEAYNAGKVMVLQYGAKQMPCVDADAESDFSFGMAAGSTYYSAGIDPANEWHEDETSIGGGGTGGGVTEEQVQEIVDAYAAQNDARVAGLELDMGDIDAALEAIIEMQNALIGGDTE